MAKFVIALFCLSTLFIGSNPFVITPQILQEVLNNKAAILKGSMPKGLKTAEGKALCTTPECVLAAAELLESLDTTADPCEDFFQYACGGWIKKNPIPDSSSRWTQFEVSREDLSNKIKGILTQPNSANDPIPVNSARDFYASCIDENTIESVGIKPLTDLLALFGGWPMTLTSWTASSFDWEAATTTGRKLYGVNFFITIFNYLDLSNSAVNTIYIDQGSLALPKFILENTESFPGVMNAYSAYMTGTAQAIRDSLNSGATNAQIDADVLATWKFETELAKINTPDEDRRNITRLNNHLLLTQIQDWTDAVPTTQPYAKIHWSKYLNDIYSSASITIPDTERIIVAETDYLQKLVALLDKTPLRTIANYVHWRFVNSLGSYTNKKMRDLALNFSNQVLGTTTPDPRTTTCTNQANDVLGFAISAKYVEDNFSDGAKKSTELLIADLKTAFKSLVDESTWMDSATKAIAKEKTDYMNELVGYPDFIKDKVTLEAYYSGVIVSKDKYWENVQNTNAFLNKETFSTLRGPVDRKRWLTYPTVVNAFYEAQMNAITFPAGILQSPFYSYGRLEAMNYGAIGNVIGHEITHGFDDEGRQSDQYGNLVNWWTDETLADYLVRAQCFIDQYSNYTLPSGTHLNGVTTQGENIADNGGLRISYLAYKLYVAANGAEQQLPGLEQFTSEQLFFLMLAKNGCGSETPERLENDVLTDIHSPPKYRVIGTLSNSEDFAREFKCPLGSPMNPPNKCILW